MAITAAMVKELRERTGAGMMECKKALTEHNGDIEAAIEGMRKSGAAKAVKKAGRVAAEGQVVIAISDDAKSGAVVEINCETDFVAKDDNFDAFCKAVGDAALAAGVESPEAIAGLSIDSSGQTVEEARQELVSKIGENIQIRRAKVLSSESGSLGSYRHGLKIGVVVELEGGDDTLARDIAMHIAASRPVCVDESEVPTEMLEKEKEIFSAQAAESGKPPEIVEKMVTGRIKKYLKEITLLGQPFVKNPDQSIAQLLKDADAKVLSFTRIEVGEGIEKKQEDFAAEVMAQVKAS
ncbi:MAG: translation elongation factor Ts [Thiotrichales bacterium]